MRNCKECKGKGFYQPLIGPSEPCQACQVTHDPKLSRVPFDNLWLSELVHGYGYMKQTFLANGYNSFYPIKYSITLCGTLKVVDGKRRVAALMGIRVDDFDAFDRILPDGLIPAIEVNYEL